MRRVFWIALGATAGVLLVRQLSRTAERFTPEALSRSLSGSGSRLAESVADFLDELRASMAEREAELRDALGLDGRHDAVDAFTLGEATPPYPDAPGER